MRMVRLALVALLVGACSSTGGVTGGVTTTTDAVLTTTGSSPVGETITTAAQATDLSDHLQPRCRFVVPRSCVSVEATQARRGPRAP